MDYPTDNLAERITSAMKNRVKLFLEHIGYVEAYWKFLFRRKMQDGEEKWINVRKNE